MARKRRDKALVLGIGNLLLRDEGAGVRTIELFNREYSFGADVVCLDGGTSGLSLLSYIRDYTHIIIVDAIRADRPPGTIVRVTAEMIEGVKDELLVPLNLSEGEISDLVAFLESLTGEPVPDDLTNNTAEP